MIRSKIFSVMAGIVAAANVMGCAPAAGPGVSPQSATGQDRVSRPFKVDDDTVLCIRLHAHREVWIPDHEDEWLDISAAFGSIIHRENAAIEYRAIPGENIGPRIFSGNPPVCEDRTKSIHLDAMYYPGPDGRPFVFEYRMEGAGGLSSGKVTRDIEAEWAAGTLEKLVGNPLQLAVTADLEVRVRSLLRELASEGG